ncbi:MAG: PIG-L family deacetylase, partial [Solirubrobacteraceae bacterium]
MSGHPVVIGVSPHPDDELLGAPATLMGLRDAGWRVINFACALGRPEDHGRRRAELTRACELAGFELVIADPPVPIG